MSAENSARLDGIAFGVLHQPAVSTDPRLTSTCHFRFPPDPSNHPTPFNHRTSANASCYPRTRGRDWSVHYPPGGHRLFPAATTSFAFVPDHSFPTPAPMDINRPTVGHAVHPAEFNPFHALMTTTPAVETTAESEETTRESEPTTESTEEATHEDYEEQSQEMTTGGQSTEITHPSTTQTTEAETIPTTQSSLPFWMFSTQRVVPQVPLLLEKGKSKCCRFHKRHLDPYRHREGRSPRRRRPRDTKR